MLCPLCLSTEVTKTLLVKPREFFRCQRCDLLFVNPAQYLSLSDEKARYLQHNNDVTDSGYQNFVLPLVEALCARLTERTAGLDFGAGTGPVLSHLLEERGHTLHRYDPFFWPHPELLERTYDFVCASEVVEHLHKPDKDFSLMRSLLKPAGVLGLMTLMHSDETDLSSWYYLKDPTHVCAYSQRTFRWIANAYQLSEPEFLSERVILFREK